MNLWGVSIFGFAAGALVLATGCGSDEFDGCGTALSCGDESSAGKGGTSGASGKGGSGGTSGDGATGQGGGAGSEAGRSGNAGTAGSGEGGTSGSGEGGTAGDAGGAGASGDGGEAGAMGGTGGGETPCDATALPGEDACVIDEEYGVFVSPAGDDGSGEGTKARPYATIGKAISVAVEDGRRVYACADGGEYAESVTLGAEASGLEMFGGFACDDWSYGTSVKSVVRAAGPEALRVAQVEGLRVEDFGFVSADATVAGGSSVAAQVVNSTGVVLRRVRLEAGKGMRGADGVTVDFAPETNLGGRDASGSLGGAPRTCACPGGAMTTGGAGGGAQPGGGNASNGAPDWGGGKGGLAGTCNVDAQRGGDAPPRESASGAAITGTLSAAGWAPAAGGNGDPGFPGQGGGGGAGDDANPKLGKGGGGGGGCGGCGGAGGARGQGGGASIALLVFESEIVVEDSELAVADAGDGGGGAAGQVGQVQGGEGGIQTTGGCPGGAGGSGGNGGTGGGGAGGISVAVLWSGELEPTLTDNEFTLGEAGAIGLGGDPGVNDGIVGLAQELLEVP